MAEWNYKKTLPTIMRIQELVSLQGIPILYCDYRYFSFSLT